MAENILQKIINNRIKEIEKQKYLLSSEILQDQISQNDMYGIKYYDFKNKISNNIKDGKISIIGEIKKASPSAGVIIEKYFPQDIAKIYKSKNITCLSVLAEKEYFLGDMMDISFCKQQCDLPILCKDFFIDKYQVLYARSKGADAILIILAGVSESLANELYEQALKLNMSVIVEVHTVEEAKKALKFKEALIGINNRNLNNFETRIETTIELGNYIANLNKIFISESGFHSHSNVNKIISLTGINNFLIGEYLMKSEQLETDIANILN